MIYSITPTNAQTSFNITLVNDALSSLLLGNSMVPTYSQVGSTTLRVLRVSVPTLDQVLPFATRYLPMNNNAQQETND